MGSEVYGVKWRNWKLHLKEQDSWHSVLRNYPIGRLYNLMTDPQERDNVIFPHGWVLGGMGPLLAEHAQSLRTERPIAPGTLDPYKPPK